jgi:hypothetical protein
MAQLPGLTKEEVQLLLDENRGADAPREYFITTQDVLNVRTKVEQGCCQYSGHSSSNLHKGHASTLCSSALTSGQASQLGLVLQI